MSTGFFLRMLVPWDHGESAGSKELRRYRLIWWRTVMLTLAVALMPLVVMTGVNYYLYRRSLHSDLQHQISQDLSNISRSIEAVIEERVSALRLVIREHDPAGLSAADVETALGNLQASFGGFVDLGLIDRRGVQVHYSGPYALEGINYSDEDWFHQVRLRGVYVSEVFLGHRHLPHFVVVVQQGDYLLRATVDMELLHRQVFIPDARPSDDVFLVNGSGILQTNSRLHGRILETCPLPVRPYSPDAEISENVDESGSPAFVGTSYVSRTPFIIVVVRRAANVLGEWLRNSREIVAFLLVSTVLIVIVVLWSLTATVEQIRAADLKQVQMLRNVEYTSKMATIGRLAASVAHEVNNPMAIINEKAGLLKDLIGSSPGYPNREKILHSLDGIIRSVERCGTVTHRLLGFTRRLKSRREQIQLPALVSEVLGFLEKEAMHRSVDIRTDFAPEAPPIMSDRGQLEEVLLNILNNAFAAVEDGGRITVGVSSEQDDRVLLSVEDDGCGISEDDLKHIFEPFFSTKGEFGTGLGLSITYELIHKLGGRISVSSQSGQGTRFTVALPIDMDRPLE
ncbi:MAG: ATP-binding protein [Acidobacteriota bacterium]